MVGILDVLFILTESDNGFIWQAAVCFALSVSCRPPCADDSMLMSSLRALSELDKIWTDRYC